MCVNIFSIISERLDLPKMLFWESFLHYGPRRAVSLPPHHLWRHTLSSVHHSTPAVLISCTFSSHFCWPTLCIQCNLWEFDTVSVLEYMRFDKCNLKFGSNTFRINGNTELQQWQNYECWKCWCFGQTMERSQSEYIQISFNTQYLGNWLIFMLFWVFQGWKLFSHLALDWPQKSISCWCKSNTYFLRNSSKFVQ